MARLAKPKAEQPGQVIRRINASLALLLSGGANIGITGVKTPQRFHVQVDAKVMFLFDLKILRVIYLLLKFFALNSLTYQLLSSL
jgi:hypothetical protein